MTPSHTPENTRPADDPAANTIQPLPGERGIPNIARPARGTMSKKGLAAAALFVISIAAVSTLYAERLFSSRNATGEEDAKRVGDRPAAANAEPKKLDLSIALPPPAPSTAASSPRIPALVPTAEEMAEPIPVRRSGPGSPAPQGIKLVAPEDAPVMLVSSRPSSSQGAAGRQSTETTTASDDGLSQTRKNLDNYQRQMQGLLNTLTQTASAATVSRNVSGTSADPLTTPTLASLSPAAQPAGLFGGQLQASATPRVSARLLGNRSLILPKGTAFTCALKTKVVSATSGLIGCQVQRNVYSDDGRVLLVERGSHMDGEYRVTSVRPGTVRIPVLWTRIRTPNGVTVDIDSPGTGPLGESGIDGYVDNRWGERIGAALLLSLIDDSVNLLIQRESNGQQGNTVVLPSTSANASKLAEKVLDSTINIPPLIYQNQGGIVGIYVARDVDFSSVYELKATER